MGYLQVLNLMVRAYKAARGVMPKGLDLLKLQQKARQKVIDSKKVIQFPKDRITDPFKPRPTKPEGIIPVTVKGKTSKMSPEGIMNMLMKQGKDVKLGQAPKTTKVKPSVDPKLVQQESTKDLYKRLTRQNREAIRNFNKRNKDDPTKKAEGGIMGYAVGGRTQNIIGTYQANPTLQDKYTQQEYLDLFDQSTTTTPTGTTTTTTNVLQPARTATGVVPNIIKPIIPQGDGGGGGGGITTVDLGLTSADNYGLGVGNQTGMGYELTEKDLEDIDDARFTSGLKNIGYDIKNFYKTVSPFLNIKRGFQKAADFSLATKKAKEEAAKAALAKEIALQAQRDRLTYSGPAFTNQDGSTISQDFSTTASLDNYDADVLR